MSQITNPKLSPEQLEMIQKNCRLIIAHHTEKLNEQIKVGQQYGVVTTPMIQRNGDSVIINISFR